MISKFRSTLSGLSAIGLFLGACLLLAQPLPQVTQAAGLDAAQASNGVEESAATVTFDVEAGLGSVKLNLTLPYYAVGKLLATRTES
ncbi:MAG: hypothetical protein KDI75_09650 [Xanthomonadales bacterium]|nr:hypothetical protein [Xanthomonadales bacterium]